MRRFSKVPFRRNHPHSAFDHVPNTSLRTTRTTPERCSSTSKMSMSAKGRPSTSQRAFCTRCGSGCNGRTARTTANRSNDGHERRSSMRRIAPISRLTGAGGNRNEAFGPTDHPRFFCPERLATAWLLPRARRSGVAVPGELGIMSEAITAVRNATAESANVVLPIAS